MSMWTEQFDVDLKKCVSHYRRYPAMMPAIGRDYGVFPCRGCLIIAESFYFPGGSSLHTEPVPWYTGRQAALTDYEVNHIDTRHILSAKNRDGRWICTDGHRIHKALEDAMIEAGMPKVENIFSTIAYMNYFQRPAKEKESLAVREEDQRISAAGLAGVFSVITPEAVVFVSEKGWRTAQNDTDLGDRKTEHTYHPRCWCKKRKGRTVAERDVFLQFIRDNVLLPQ